MDSQQFYLSKFHFQPPQCSPGHQGGFPSSDSRGIISKLPIPPGLHRRLQQQSPLSPFHPETSSFEKEPQNKPGFPKFSNDQSPEFVETRFPEEKPLPSHKFVPSKNDDFFGPIRRGGHQPLTLESRKEAVENSFGATGYELSPFGSPFKDSPLNNDTFDAVLDEESFLIDDVMNLTDTVESKRIGRATKQMESDVTVELTVMPIENGKF